MEGHKRVLPKLERAWRIETKYGQPIVHWQDLIHAKLPAKHMELVKFLKEEHVMGHVHANVLVAATLAEG